ncbi:MAG: Fe(3+) ABC transporter substrate-binding protein, partial [Balneolaceae bacterium]
MQQFTAGVLILFIVFSGISCGDREELNIYSARHYNTDLKLYDAFTERTGIKINLIEGGSDELIERIKSEGINSPADILITVDAGRLWRAEEAGILQPVHSELLNSVIPDELKDPDGHWFGFSRRVRGIIYNKERVNPNELKGYWELTDEVWRNRLCVRSSNNIYNQSLVASLIETRGIDETEKWVEMLVANFARSPQGGDTDQIKAVATGQCDIAIANHYYLARLATSSDENDRLIAELVGIYFPNKANGGTHVNISGAGVLKHSPNRSNAIRFLEYLTEDEPQHLFSVGNLEYPVSESFKLPD